MIGLKIIRLIRLRRIKAAIREFNRLKKKGEIDKLPNLVRKMTFVRLNIKRVGKLENYIFGNLVNIEIVTRQLLTRRIINHKLILRLFASRRAKGKLSFCLPKEWVNFLSDNEYSVYRSFSSIIWFFCMTLYIAHGLRGLAYHLLYPLINIFINRKDYLASDCHFVNLPLASIPNQRNLENSIFQWYCDYDELRSSGKNKKRISYNHKTRSSFSIRNTSIQSQLNLLPPLSFLKSYFQFMSWAFVAIGASIINLFLGKWWYAFLLKEASDAAVIRFSASETLSKEYLFSQSSFAYRPLWTYAAEEKGSKIVLFFYATNIQGFQTLQNKMNPPYHGYELMTWPIYYVWNQYQEKFVKNCVSNNPSFEIVPPVPIENYETFKPEVLDSEKKVKIAIFDIQPVRKSILVPCLPRSTYLDGRAVIKMLGDIQELIKNNAQIVIYFKRKRNLSSNWIQKSYLKKLEQIESAQFKSLDPSFTISSIIKHVDLVLSMPFTSTAPLASYLEVPSIYYDPLHQIIKNDPSAHGVPVISGKDDLSQYISSFTYNLTNKEKYNASKTY